MPQILWGRWFVVSTAIVASGWAIMRYTTPTEEQFYAKLSPELKKQMDEVRARRQGNAEMMKRLEEAAKNGEVVWGDTLDNPPNIKKK